MKPEKQLYQWDVNQYLTGINPAAQYVDYTIGNEVIRLETEGGRCRIPDEILQTYGGKTCYERYPDGTYRAYSFTVLYAPKPPDYVYTPEERTTFEALTARVDAAIEEIKRRADSGEFDGKTPVKGVDYYTKEEQAELITAVSSGAESEFRKVTEEEMAKFEATAESKLTDYNRNAAEKLTTYDTNAEQHTSDYNRNSEVKLESYNQNHTEKLAEYNQNAETKKAEFDASVGEQIAGKANVDGYYEEMTVGDAEQLVATQFVEDNEPYRYRTTGGSADVGNREYVDAIVGGTVAWNQLVPNFVANNEYGFERCTGVFSDGVATLTVNANGATKGRATMYNFKETKVSVPIATHKYFLTCCVKPSVAVNRAIISFGNGNSTIKNILTENAWNLVEGLSTHSTPSGHYVQVDVYGTLSVGDTAQIKNFMVIDLTQMFGSTIADYIYSLERSQAGAGVAWFKKLFPNDYYAYNAGELLSVEGLKSHDTVGFNQWDEEWEVGDISTSTGEDATATNRIRSKGFMPCLPNIQYCFTASDGSLGTELLPFFYDANKQFISVGSWSNVQNVQATPQNCHYMRFKESVTYGTTYNHDICINLSNPSRNGEYEPYEKHSYPLDNSLTLRGIPKLDASNNLYYDGDEYASDGKVKRKYGVVDLGTIDWVQGGGNNKTSWVPVSWRTNVKPVENVGIKANILCNKYKTDTSEHVEHQINDKTIAVNTNCWVYIYDSEYVSVTPQEFKAAMSGVYLVYELATPTTETAEPYNEIQICDDFGTEEFVSTGIVPVGHKTRYPANLRDKLQHLPDLASADGTYLIKQTGKQMSLIHMPAVFPNTPTDDGTYTLKTVVTGGVATLQWVVE